MNSLDALYLPTTSLWSLRQYPQFLLFSKVHLLSPVENDPAGAGEKDTNSFINSGLCQVHTPCPLGADRERFLRLVADIRARTDDYAAQLSALTLASYSSTPPSGENSEREIIDSMFIPGDLAARDAEDNRQEQLWRTRLILAISDLLDQQQEEIAFHMRALENDEQDLFEQLQGEGDEMDGDEELFEILANLRATMSQPAASMVKNRLKAWKMLYQQATDLPAEAALLTDFDCGELLLEMYEKQSGQSAMELGKLSLPALLGPDDDSALQSVTTFHKNCSESLGKLQEIVASAASSDGAGRQSSLRRELNEVILSLQNKVDAEFPEKKYGRRVVRILLFAGADLHTVLHAASGSAKREQPAAGTVAFICE